jgi:hypothetical protein
MNIFMMSISVIYLGAAGWEWTNGSRLLTVVYFSWAISNFALAVKQ